MIILLVTKLHCSSSVCMHDLRTNHSSRFILVADSKTECLRFSMFADTVHLTNACLWSPYVIGRPYIFSCCGLLWSPYVIGQTIIFSSCFFLLSSSFFFLAQSQRSEIGCLPYFGTWCGLSANIECRSEMCCTRLAANTGRKKSPSWHHRTTLSGHIFATKACIDNRKKNLLSSNTSSTCPDNMMNFGPVAAEICWRVWGTPVNFNGFCVLTALLHGI